MGWVGSCPPSFACVDHEWFIWGTLTGVVGLQSTVQTCSLCLQMDGGAEPDLAEIVCCTPLYFGSCLWGATARHGLETFAEPVARKLRLQTLVVLMVALFFGARCPRVLTFWGRWSVLGLAALHFFSTVRTARAFKHFSFVGCGCGRGAGRFVQLVSFLAMVADLQPLKACPTRHRPRRGEGG